MKLFVLSQAQWVVKRFSIESWLRKGKEIRFMRSHTGVRSCVGIIKRRNPERGIVIFRGVEGLIEEYIEYLKDEFPKELIKYGKCSNCHR